jgi:hypothetical protein
MAPAGAGGLQRALRERAVRQVVAPENREELLARLRARARRLGA